MVRMRLRNGVVFPDMISVCADGNKTDSAERGFAPLQKKFSRREVMEFLPRPVNEHTNACIVVDIRVNGIGALLRKRFDQSKYPRHKCCLPTMTLKGRLSTGDLLSLAARADQACFELATRPSTNRTARAVKSIKADTRDRTELLSRCTLNCRCTTPRNPTAVRKTRVYPDTSIAFLSQRSSTEVNNETCVLTSCRFVYAQATTTTPPPAPDHFGQLVYDSRIEPAMPHRHCGRGGSVHPPLFLW
jgi:hypothetical protein